MAMNKKFTHSGNIILAGFVFLIILMSLMFYRISREKFEMVTENYYEKEMAFQGHIDAAKNSEVLGERFSMKTGKDFVTMVIPGELSVNMHSGEAYFYCPLGESNDKRLPIQPSADGAYTFNTSDWKKTKYFAKISFESGGKKYFKEFELDIK